MPTRFHSKRNSQSLSSATLQVKPPRKSQSYTGFQQSFGGSSLCVTLCLRCSIQNVHWYMQHVHQIHSQTPFPSPRPCARSFHRPSTLLELVLHSRLCTTLSLSLPGHGSLLPHSQAQCNYSNLILFILDHRASLNVVASERKDNVEERHCLHLLTYDLLQLFGSVLVSCKSPSRGDRWYLWEQGQISKINKHEDFWYVFGAACRSRQGREINNYISETTTIHTGKNQVEWAKSGCGVLSPKARNETTHTCSRLNKVMKTPTLKRSKSMSKINEWDINKQ